MNILEDTDTSAGVSSYINNLRHNIRLDRITYMPVTELKRYQRKLRKRSEKAKEALAASVKGFGIVLPILIDQHSTIIAGEGIFDAAVSLAEQIATVEELADANGGGDFRWASTAEERSKLWKARHEAYYAAVNLRPGAVGWSTDVCVPISCLPECILSTKADLAVASMPATILGHVGDGNFHVIFSIDPNNPNDMAEAAAINARLVERALAMDGTCTGEHGIGIGKQDWLEKELGNTVDTMRLLKRAIDPQNLFNPGKIFQV